MKKLLFFFLLISIFGVISCDQEDEPQPNNSNIEVVKSGVDGSSNGGPNDPPTP